MQVLGGLIAIGIGSTALYACRSNKRERVEMLGWPSVPGRITDRRLERRSGSGTSSGFTYTPAFRYAYSVDGVEHTGDTRNLDWSSGSIRWLAQRRMARTPDALPVRYDPADPAKSTLAPPGRSDVWIWAIVGVVLIVTGLVLFFA